MAPTTLQHHVALANELLLLADGGFGGLDQGDLHFFEQVLALADQLFLAFGGDDHRLAERGLDLREVLPVFLSEFLFACGEHFAVSVERLDQ